MRPSLRGFEWRGTTVRPSVPSGLEFQNGMQSQLHWTSGLRGKFRNVRNAPSLMTFRRDLKTVLFRSSFDLH